MIAPAITAAQVAAEQKKAQEAILAKVKTELETQLNQNLSKIEDEVNKIREKQSTLAQTIDSAKRAEHEREIALSMQRPAQMLDELKS